MRTKLIWQHLFLLSLLFILLLPGVLSSTVAATSKEIKESTAMKPGQCVVDAQVTDSQGPKVPDCPSGEVSGGGVGFKIYWNVKWGGDHWIRRGFNVCKLPMESWKADLDKAPYTDLLMKFYTQEEIAAKTGYYNTDPNEDTAKKSDPLGTKFTTDNRKLNDKVLGIGGNTDVAYEKESDLGKEACPPGYDKLGVFTKKKRSGILDQPDIDFLGGPGVLCGKRGLFPSESGATIGSPEGDPSKKPEPPGSPPGPPPIPPSKPPKIPTIPTAAVTQVDQITGYAIDESFPADLTLPLVQDFKLLGCVDCDAAPSCPEGYVTRGKPYHGTGEVRSQRMSVGYTFCVKYNVACACRTPDQCKDLCESTDAASMPNPPEGYPVGEGGGFAVDGGAGVWVKETPTLTTPFNGVLPALPPEIVIDGTADPFFLRFLRPDGTLYGGVYGSPPPGKDEGGLLTSSDSILNQKGNCCLDGDECEQICTRNDPAGKWLEGTEPFADGVKLFEDPKFGKCVESGLGAMINAGEGEKVCGKIMNGPCCGDDDKNKKWYFDGGGDCTDTQDGQKQLCISSAPDGEHKWMSTEEALAAEGEEGVWRPLCQAAEWDVKDGKWGWAKEKGSCYNGHRVVICGFRYERNGGDKHGPVIAGMFGDGLKKPGQPCELIDMPPHRRVNYCGETTNVEDTGGINFDVFELARFFCGFTYCRTSNTFGKDLDEKYLENCEQFPIIKAKDGGMFPEPGWDTTVTENKLVNTGNHCCGEVDDDDPGTPFDGEFYDDAGGKGACFINYQPNGAFLQHNVKVVNLKNMIYNLGASLIKVPINGAYYVADAREAPTPDQLIGDTTTHEEKGVFVYNGTLVGCKLEGAYNPSNDYLIDIKDNPNWAKGKKFSDMEVPIHDPTDDGTSGETSTEEPQNDTPLNLAGEAKKAKKSKAAEKAKENVIREQPYCSKTGPPEDITAYYCSYTEKWLERNGTARDFLKKIEWNPENTLISIQLVPSIDNTTNETLAPARSDKPHYLIKNETNETTNSSEVIEQTLFTDQECCSNTQCWDGFRCIDDQSANPADPVDPYTLLKNGDGYRCLKGVWKPALLKYTPDGSENGYCPQTEQCLYDLEGNESQNGCTEEGCAPQCINDQQYIQDDYCQNGSWTTRTRILAQILLDKTRVETDAKDYILFCDKASIALNNLQNPGNTNHYCVLTFDGQVVFGTSYNGNRSGMLDALKQSTLFSFDNLDGNNTEAQTLGQSCTSNDNFAECVTLKDRDGNELLHAYHQGGLRMLILSAKPVPGFDNTAVFTIAWDWLKDLFRSILQTNNEPFELTDFKQIYLSSLTPQRIYGITETLFSQNKSTNESKAFDQLITIEYTGYTVDFSNLLGGVTAERKQVNGTNESQTVFLLNPSQDLWPQFTEKLRPKRVIPSE